MKLFETLKRHLFGDFDADVIDHAPISGARSYEQKLRDAAAKHGRPFKCAAAGLPRQLFDGHECVTVTAEGGRVRPEQPQTPAFTLKRVK
jgi:hypothetical protein